MEERWSRLVNWCKRTDINWSNLNKVHDVKLISSMYVWIFIVPVAAKVLSGTNELALVTIFDYTFELHLKLPFSWQLFYFSALFFAGATLIYNLLCPKLIQQYPSYSSFEREGKQEWHLRPFANDIELSYDDFKFDLEESMREEEGRIYEGKEYMQSVFWHLYWKADRARKTAYIVCCACYAVGFMLISVVFVQNFWWVLKNIFGF
ncbi:hypothetical protein NX014_21980 [Vibrio vulnificus]|uniref:hypothetical protein n=1 Tax=Vibrio vulnificus TaxID=672 RepID=UPI0028DF1B24|nr:hypothetical protein [Vibrio vulnificus]MDT8826914.1 hypothetical protein [Vibrio vulnificus]